MEKLLPTGCFEKRKEIPYLKESNQMKQNVILEDKL